MTLKTKKITIEKGRDKGVTFLLTEMPVVKADKWAMKALLAMASSGITVPNPREGMLGISRVAFSALKGMPEDKTVALLDELLECVQIVPEGGSARSLDLSLNDVKDFSTLWLLRKEVFMLHIDFLRDVLTQISE
ncbi:hypothetical protein ACWA5Z_06765 [Testudinibacter sp. P80/BLE/0925]